MRVAIRSASLACLVAVASLVSAAPGGASGSVCSLVVPSALSAALHEGPVAVISHSSTSCFYAGPDREIEVSVRLEGGGKEFRSILNGSQRPYTGFLSPGTSIDSLRRSAKVFSGTTAYGEKLPVVAPFTSGYSFLASHGSSTLVVAALVKGGARDRAQRVGAVAARVLLRRLAWGAHSG